MIKHFLLVEDERPKRDTLFSFLQSKFPEAKISTASSTRSAVDSAISGSFQAILLDMSLPTFDKSDQESGGRPQGFGGIEVLRYMVWQKVSTPVIVITGYDEFSEGSRYLSVEELTVELKDEFGAQVEAVVLFNALSSDWEDALMMALQGVVL